jgi:hypothetical protein
MKNLPRSPWLFEAVLVVLFLALVTWSVIGSKDRCGHVRHEGVCGREYQTMVGKIPVRKICDCAKIHY